MKLVEYFKEYKKMTKTIELDNNFIEKFLFMCYNENIISDYFLFFINVDSLSLLDKNGELIFKVYYFITEFKVTFYDIVDNRTYTCSIKNKKMIHAMIEINNVYDDILKLLSSNFLYNKYIDGSKLTKWIIKKHMKYIIKNLNFLGQYLSQTSTSEN